ncbi:MAG: tetratricopeptide repeat protein [Terriglobia bacterium]
MRRVLTPIALLLICVAAGLTVSRQTQARPAAQASSGDQEYTPPSAQKSVEIANFYLHKKDYRAALSRFLEATHTDPDYAPEYEGLGRVYEATGQKQKALEAFLKYLEELPSDSAAARAKDANRAVARLKRQLTPAQVKAAEKNARSLPAR